MHIYRTFAAGRYPRPCIAEMGGKNPAIVSRNANLEDAADGHHALGLWLQGQKCSANSRVYCGSGGEGQADPTAGRQTAGHQRWRPDRAQNWMGPVINANAYRSSASSARSCRRPASCDRRPQPDGRRLGKGYYAEPTLVDGVDKGHRLWKQEMFLPITMITASSRWMRLCAWPTMWTTV